MAKETPKPRRQKPKKKQPTQNERILAMLESGRCITVFQLHQIGINSATARISELRKQGYIIKHRDKTMKNQFGVNVKYREYWLVRTPAKTLH